MELDALARLAGLAHVDPALGADLNALRASVQPMLALELTDVGTEHVPMPVRPDVARPYPSSRLLDARTRVGTLVDVPGVPGLTQAMVQKTEIQRGEDGPKGLPQWPPTRDDA